MFFTVVLSQDWFWFTHWSDDRRTLCSISSALVTQCWQFVMTRHTPWCWASRGHDILVTLRGPPSPRPTDILAPRACGGRAASGPGDGGRYPWHRTCRGPGTGAWCSWRPGRGGWRPWRGSSPGCWGNAACNSVTPGDGDPCQSRGHTWPQRGTCHMSHGSVRIMEIWAGLPEGGPELGQLTEAVVWHIGALGQGELPQPRAVHCDAPNSGIWEYWG